MRYVNRNSMKMDIYEIFNINNLISSTNSTFELAQKHHMDKVIFSFSFSFFSPKTHLPIHEYTT